MSTEALYILTREKQFGPLHPNHPLPKFLSRTISDFNGVSPILSSMSLLHISRRTNIRNNERHSSTPYYLSRRQILAFP